MPAIRGSALALQKGRFQVFVSFFPQPRLFFLSAVAWSLAAVLFWFFGGEQLGAVFGLPPAPADVPPVLGVPIFWTGPFIWFYIYFGFFVAAFYYLLANIFASSVAGLVYPRVDADLAFNIYFQCSYMSP